MCSLKIHGNSNECQHDILYVNKVKPINKIHAQSCNRNAIKLKKTKHQNDVNLVLVFIFVYSKTFWDIFCCNHKCPNLVRTSYFSGISSFFLVLRKSHRRCSITKGDLRNLTKFSRKRLCQSLFLNKIAGLRAATLFKMRPWHRCFLWILWNF